MTHFINKNIENLEHQKKHAVHSIPFVHYLEFISMAYGWSYLTCRINKMVGKEEINVCGKLPY